MRTRRQWVVALAVGVGFIAAPAGVAHAATSLFITGSVTDPPTLNAPASVKVAGHYAYVAAFLSGALTVVDERDPAHPVEVGSVSDPHLFHATGVDVVGTYAYVTSKDNNTLAVVDVSTPSHPAVVGSLTDNNLLMGAYTVQVVGSYAYVAAQGCVVGGTFNNCPAAGGNALTVVDVSDPAHPRIAGSVSDPTLATDHLDSVEVVGTRAYGTAFYSKTFTVFDVSDPTHPAILTHITDATNLPWPNDVDVKGSDAYVVNQTGTGRLTVVDVSNPAVPTVEGSVASSATLDNAYALQVSGNYAFVAARNNNALTVVDVSNPVAPSVVDSLSDANALGHDLEVSLQRGQAFVAAFCVGPCATATTGAVTAVDIGAYAPATDLTPPDTTIDTGPPGLTSSANASFSFSATEAGSTFECRLDARPWRACTSPQSYSGLADGAHQLQVAATDPSGNLDTTPATWNWASDTTAPKTVIDSAPKAFTSSRSATISFHASEPGVSFSCALDGAAAAPCTSPLVYGALADGPHTLRITATDPAGNVENSPRTVSWTVDTTAPSTTIVSGPPSKNRQTASHFVLAANEAGVTFQCSLDGHSWGSCASRFALPSLRAGLHVFAARAIDAAGNVDATPAYRDWQSGKPPRLRPGKGGVLRLRLAPQPFAVSGTVRLTLGGGRAVRAHFKGAAGRPVTIKLRLDRATLARLARGVRATAVLTLVDSAGGRSTVRYAFTLVG